MNDEERFGFSLLLKDGDLELEADPATGRRRLRTVSGKANLLQALELRVLTPFGSDPFNIRYGLDVTRAFTQPAGLRMVKEFLKLSLVQTLSLDPRVQDIREVLFEDDPAYLARHPEISSATVAIDRRRRFWQVEVIVQTVQEQTEALSFRIGV